jgi:MFS family permease
MRLGDLAVAKNIATMLVSRFFDGLAGSAFLSVAGGSVGDMFPRDRLQAPMMIYTASPFIGPGTTQCGMRCETC